MGNLTRAEKDAAANVQSASGQVFEAVKHITKRMTLRLIGETDSPPSKAARIAIAFIAYNYAKNIGLDDIAQAAQISKFHFIRKFRREIGITPGAFLQHYRISEAMRLLAETDRPIRDIARASGYADPAAFSRAFLKLVGVQPYRYRRARREEISLPRQSPMESWVEQSV